MKLFELSEAMQSIEHLFEKDESGNICIVKHPSISNIPHLLCPILVKLERLGCVAVDSTSEHFLINLTHKFGSYYDYCLTHKFKSYYNYWTISDDNYYSVCEHATDAMMIDVKNGKRTFCHCSSCDVWTMGIEKNHSHKIVCKGECHILIPEKTFHQFDLYRIPDYFVCVVFPVCFNRKMPVPKWELVGQTPLMKDDNEHNKIHMNTIVNISFKDLNNMLISLKNDSENVTTESTSFKAKIYIFRNKKSGTTKIQGICFNDCVISPITSLSTLTSSIIEGWEKMISTSQKFGINLLRLNGVFENRRYIDFNLSNFDEVKNTMNAMSKLPGFPFSITHLLVTASTEVHGRLCPTMKKTITYSVSSVIEDVFELLMKYIKSGIHVDPSAIFDLFEIKKRTGFFPFKIDSKRNKTRQRIFDDLNIDKRLSHGAAIYIAITGHGSNNSNEWKLHFTLPKKQRMHWLLEFSQKKFHWIVAYILYFIGQTDFKIETNWMFKLWNSLSQNTKFSISKKGRQKKKVSSHSYAPFPTIEGLANTIKRCGLYNKYSVIAKEGDLSTGEGATRHRMNLFVKEHIANIFGENATQPLNTVPSNDPSSLFIVMAWANYQCDTSIVGVPCLEWLEYASSQPPSITTIINQNNKEFLDHLSSFVSEDSYSKNEIIVDKINYWICCENTINNNSQSHCSKCFVEKSEETHSWVKEYCCHQNTNYNADKLLYELWASTPTPRNLSFTTTKLLFEAYEPLFDIYSPGEIFKRNRGWELIKDDDITLNTFLQNASSNCSNCPDRTHIECGDAALKDDKPCPEKCPWGLLALVITEACSVHKMKIKDLVYFSTSYHNLPLPENNKLKIDFEGEQMNRLPTSATCFLKLRLHWKDMTNTPLLDVRSRFAAKMALAVKNNTTTMGLH
ncbi:MAG: hypothetical protein DRH76_07500 [Deltaproteobacteria bacterium]|nr:MAG: hypothetical protein DRH76_07500 [Deltaproteobacteria bacterium]